MTVVWPEPAQESLRRIHYEDARRVVLAVNAFAETGVGRICRLAEDDRTTVRLRVGTYRVRMSLDKPASTIWIWYVYRVA